MGKNQSASNLTNIIKQDANGNISFVSGSTTLMSVSSSGAITTTGNVAGTASYASNAELLDGLDSTVFTLTSSFAAQTASFTAFTASQNILNGKYATTGSNTFTGIQTVNSNLIVTGSITAQTLVVQTITSSVDFVTGSTRFGSILGNTHVFSGSVTMNPGGLFVSSSGLVGIGNVIPAYTLDVSGTGRFTGTTILASTSGSVGVAVTPSGWGSGYIGFQVGPAGSQMATGNNNRVGLNFYYDGGASFKAIQTGAASLIEFDADNIRFKNAASVSGGSAQTINERMTISAAGGVALTGNGNLDINPASGTANISLRSGNTYQGYIEAISGGGILFGTGASATERMRIASGGQVIAPYGYQSFKGSTSITAGGTNTIYTMSTDGVYYVYCRLNGGAQYYLASAIVTGLPSGGTSQISNTYNGSNVNINLSGNDIRITSGAYSTYTWQWSILYQPVD
jgi:hypothetical protein